MTTWRDGGDCGRVYREITDEDESYVIAKVRTRLSAFHRPVTNPATPWPEGEANFALILAAPKMLEALKKIAALEAPGWSDLDDEFRTCHQHKEIARVAIAAVKGDSSSERG